jgi:hypothetical protein
MAAQHLKNISFIDVPPSFESGSTDTASYGGGMHLKGKKKRFLIIIALLRTGAYKLRKFSGK